MLKALEDKQYGINKSQREEAQNKFTWTYFSKAHKGFTTMCLELMIGGQHTPPVRILTRSELELLVHDGFYLPNVMGFDEKQAEYEEGFVERVVRRKLRNMSEKEREKEESRVEAAGKKGKGKSKAIKSKADEVAKDTAAAAAAGIKDHLTAKEQEAPKLVDFSMYEMVAKSAENGWEEKLDRIYGKDLADLSLHIQLRCGTAPRQKKGAQRLVIPQLTQVGLAVILSSISWEKIGSHGYAALLKPLLHAALFEMEALKTYRPALVVDGAGQRARTLLAEVLAAYTQPEFTENVNGTQTWFGWWDEAYMDLRSVKKLQGNKIHAKDGEESKKKNHNSLEDADIVKDFAAITQRETQGKTIAEIQTIVQTIERSPLTRMELNAKGKMSKEVSVAITALVRVSNSGKEQR